MTWRAAIYDDGAREPKKQASLPDYISLCNWIRAVLTGEGVNVHVTAPQGRDHRSIAGAAPSRRPRNLLDWCVAVLNRIVGQRLRSGCPYGGQEPGDLRLETVAFNRKRLRRAQHLGRS